MQTSIKHIVAGALLACCSITALAAVPADQAEKLKTTLTPFGAERAGNKDGTIPAWTGGMTQPIAGYEPGGRRVDPFASEKPLFSITSNNASEYADRLSDGQLALLKKYPDYRIDVYPTHRTAAAPQWVYDNTFANATRATTAKDGNAVEGAYGGIPFPIPQSGAEAIWNYELNWRGIAFRWDFRVYTKGAGNGAHVLASDNIVEEQHPYYYPDGNLDSFKGYFMKLRIRTFGPPQHVGEAVVEWLPTDFSNGIQAWQYITGQRRVRKAPNLTYDTPSFFTSGITNYDEVMVFIGGLDHYTWKIVGKKELFIPYNNNGTLVPAKDADILGERFLNPDHVRWELHRVWVVDGELAPGKRHVLPKRRFYLDEDTWQASLVDSWDGKGQLWKSFWGLNMVAPELPGTVLTMFGHYDLQTGEWIANTVVNEKSEQIAFPKPWPESYFTADSLAGTGVR